MSSQSARPPSHFRSGDSATESRGSGLRGTLPVAMARVSDPVASSEAATPPASQLPIEGPRFLPWARPRRRAPTELFRVWHPHPPASDAGGHLSPGPACVGVGHVSRDARLRNPSPCILPGRSDPRCPPRAAFRSTFQPTGRLTTGACRLGLPPAPSAHPSTSQWCTRHTAFSGWKRSSY